MTDFRDFWGWTKAFCIITQQQVYRGLGVQCFHSLGQLNSWSPVGGIVGGVGWCTLAGGVCHWVWALTVYGHALLPVCSLGSRLTASGLTFLVLPACLSLAAMLKYYESSETTGQNKFFHKLVSVVVFYHTSRKEINVSGKNPFLVYKRKKLYVQPNHNKLYCQKNLNITKMFTLCVQHSYLS